MEGIVVNCVETWILLGKLADKLLGEIINTSSEYTKFIQNHVNTGGVVGRRGLKTLPAEYKTNMQNCAKY
jgi:hypothetical protein